MKGILDNKCKQETPHITVSNSARLKISVCLVTDQDMMIYSKWSCSFKNLWIGGEESAAQTKSEPFFWNPESVQTQ
jgi:hypothetical protein